MHDDHREPSLSDDLEAFARQRVARRKVLGLFAAGGLATFIGCGDDGQASTTAGSTGTGGGGGAGGTGATGATTDAATTGATSGTTSTSTGGGACETIPPETAGPFPGDGSNGPNALTTSGVVRSDMRASFGGASGVAQGITLTITLTVVDVANGCAPLAGHAVYLWHCDANGDYSMYSAATVDENYLRAVQETDAEGRVTFTTIFPGAYPGRWPHMHFEIYPSLAATSSPANKLATSQLAFPEESCNEVYATTGYETSAQHLASMSLETDGVFSDGAALQVATMSGSAGTELVAELSIGV